MATPIWCSHFIVVFDASDILTPALRYLSLSSHCFHCAGSQSAGSALACLSADRRCCIFSRQGSKFGRRKSFTLWPGRGLCDLSGAVYDWRLNTYVSVVCSS